MHSWERQGQGRQLKITGARKVSSLEIRSDLGTHKPQGKWCWAQTAPQASPIWIKDDGSPTGSVCFWGKTQKSSEKHHSGASPSSRLSSRNWLGWVFPLQSYTIGISHHIYYLKTKPFHWDTHGPLIPLPHLCSGPVSDLILPFLGSVDWVSYFSIPKA